MSELEFLILRMEETSYSMNNSDSFDGSRGIHTKARIHTDTQENSSAH